MAKEYYTTEELKDYESLKDFNSDKLNLNSLGQTPPKYYYDASGYTTTNQIVEMELKNRNGELLSNNRQVKLYKAKTNTPYTASTIYIEPQHYSRMKDDYEWDKNIVPLYINFLSDGVTLVWNLSSLKKKPEWKWVTNIWDEAEEKYKNEWRVLLPINEAFIYKNKKLIYKPKSE